MRGIRNEVKLPVWSKGVSDLERLSVRAKFTLKFLVSKVKFNLLTLNPLSYRCFTKNQMRSIVIAMSDVKYMGIFQWKIKPLAMTS